MSDQLGFYVMVYKVIKCTFSSTFLYIKSLHYKLYYIGVIQIFIFYICVIQASQVFFQLQAVSMGRAREITRRSPTEQLEYGVVADIEGCIGSEVLTPTPEQIIKKYKLGHVFKAILDC